VPRTFDWTDVHLIAELLDQAHPEVEILKVRFTDLHQWVSALPGFAGDPQRSSEKILEAIQMAWLDERE